MLGIYVMIQIILYNIPNILFCISTYYQLINFLNTKNNIMVVLLTLIILFKNSFKDSNITILYFITIFWIFYMNIDSNINQILNQTLSSTTAPNTNLLNGIMLIHPVVLYFFYSVYLLEYKVNLKKLFFQIKKFKSKNSNQKILASIFVILYAILLGGWWAEQELSWGGWWSWDFVELLSVNYLLYYLILQHKKSSTNQNNHFRWSIIFKPSLLIISIMAVRFNIINSIHNFINLESQNQYFYYILYALVFFLLLGLSKIFLKLSFFKRVGISIESMFIYFLFIFYLFFILSLDFFNLFFLNLFSYLKIKYLYMWLIFLSIIFISFLKSIYRSGILLISIFIILIVFLFGILVPSRLVDLIIIVLALFCFKKSKSVDYNTKQELAISILHFSILVLFLISIHQIYNFLPFLKISYQPDPYIKSINNYIYNSLGVFFLKTSIISGNNDIITGVYGSGVFEKRLYYSNPLTFFELYTYNNQTLIQLYGGLLFIIIFILLTVLFFISRQYHRKINL